MRYLLDTCILGELQKPQPSEAVMVWFAEQPDHSLYISVMTVGEIRKGVARLAPSARQSQLSRWLESLVYTYQDRILPVTLEAAESWGILSARALLRGRPLPVVDGIIGATAKAHGLSVATRNIEHFLECGVEVVNPWQDASPAAK